MVGAMSIGFPLTRSISHQIDLIPGLGPPRKEPHKMTLVENFEFN